MKSVKKAVKKAAIARKKAVAKKKAAVARPKVDAVAAAQGEAKVDPHPALREEYTIEARNFGPIEEAKLTLKPLTVLIGPSNTGKTYMATLAYMVANEHTQFVQAARRAMFLTPYEAMLKKIGNRELRGIAASMVGAIEKGGSFVSLSDLPEKFRNPWRTIARDMFKQVTWGDVKGDLGRYFGVGSDIDGLIGAGGDALACKYQTQMNGGVSAHARVEFRKKSPSVSAKLSEFYFPTLAAAMSEGIAKIKESLSSPSAFRQRGVAEVEKIIDKMFQGDAQGAAADPSAHFLPASRDGLIQAPQAMAMIMSTTPSRAIADYLREVNILSGRLSGSKEQSDIVRRIGISRVSNLAGFRVRLRNTTPEIMKVAEKIEGLLGGKIDAKKFDGNGPAALRPPPTLVYRPAEAKIELEMIRSSSMVGELAPLVLYLKGGIEPGDTLFIEEPEAHLHPAAQTKMAGILAAMVRAGIRVVITTHSDWLLDSIANLVRQGELGAGDGETTLKADDVGVWLFRRDAKDAGSTAVPVPFDNSGGYIPESLSDFFIGLHNQSANWQIAYDKARRDKERA